MIKKYKIIIIALVLIIFAAGGWWYYQKNYGENSEKDKTAFTTGFILLDDEKNLSWSGAVQLTTEAKTQFENEIAKIKADLLVAKDNDQLLADYSNLAIYEKSLGNYREAYDAYLNSLKLNDQFRVTWQNFGDVLLSMKAYKSAAMAYKKAIELNKYLPESYVKLADYYKAVGNDAEVEATYKTALETIKDSLESDTLILDAYAEWLAGKGRNIEAIKIYEELKAKQPSNGAAIDRKIENLKK